MRRASIEALFICWFFGAVHIWSYPGVASLVAALAERLKIDLHTIHLQGWGSLSPSALPSMIVWACERQLQTCCCKLCFNIEKFDAQRPPGGRISKCSRLFVDQS